MSSPTTLHTATKKHQHLVINSAHRQQLIQNQTNNHPGRRQLSTSTSMNASHLTTRSTTAQDGKDKRMTFDEARSSVEAQRRRRRRRRKLANFHSNLWPPIPCVRVPNIETAIRQYQTDNKEALKQAMRNAGFRPLHTSESSPTCSSGNRGRATSAIEAKS